MVIIFEQYLILLYSSWLITVNNRRGMASWKARGAGTPRLTDVVKSASAKQQREQEEYSENEELEGDSEEDEDELWVEVWCLCVG